MQCLNFEGCRCRSSACLPPGYNKRPTSVGSLRAKRVDDSFFKTGSAIRIDFDVCFCPEKIVHIAAMACTLLATKLSLPEAQLVGFDFYDSSHEKFNC